MNDSESIRIGSIIGIPHCGVMESAEVIGYVLGRGAPSLRVRYLDTDVVELRSDLTNDDVRLIQY